MRRGLSELESKTMAWVQNRGIQQIRTGDLVRSFGVPAKLEHKVLSGMAKRGLAARVRRGLYLLPRVLPLGGRWSPGDALALTTLMQDRDGRFQICGPNAFHRYGWDEQVPNRIYAYNNRLSGDRSIGQVELTLIRVGDARLGGTEIVSTPENIDLVYSSRTRSLVDAVYDWSRFNSLPRGFGWIRDDLEEAKISTADLVEALSEQVRTPARLLTRLERSLNASSSTVPWIPTSIKRGRVSKRWGVVVNGTIP
jgi:predicted transcriptional regulator of viral defense system